MTDTLDAKEQEKQDPFGQQLLRMYRAAEGAYGYTHRRWAALLKVRDGTYTQDMNTPSWKTRYRSNDAISIIEQLKAMMLSNLPVPRAVSDNEADIADGKCDIANAVIDELAASANYEKFCDLAADDLHSTGPAIVKLCYEPQLKNALTFRLVNPLNWFPDPAATDIVDMEYCVERIIKPKSWLLRRWPDKREIIDRAAEVTGTVGSVSGDVSFQYLHETPNDYDRAGKAYPPGQNLNAPVLILEFHLKDDTLIDIIEEYDEPTGELYDDGKPRMRKAKRPKKVKKYPKGRRVLLTRTGETITDGKNTDPDGMFPYVVGGAYWRAHKLMPTGDLDLIAPTAILLDKMYSIMADNAQFLAYPALAIDPQSGIDRQTSICRPGQVLFLRNPNYTMRPIEMPRQHDAIYTMFTALRSQIRSITAAWEETQGLRPRGDVTGKSVDALAGLASIRPRMKQSNFERFIGELFHRLFQYAKAYYPENKTIITNPLPGSLSLRRTMSTPQRVESTNPYSSNKVTWDRKAMRDSEVRIVVEPGSSMPVDPDTEYAATINARQTIIGLNGGPQNPAAFLIAQEIIPDSYIIAQMPLRNKMMMMRRAYELEQKRAQAQGQAEAMAEEASKASQQDMTAMAYGRAAGAPQQMGMMQPGVPAGQ